MTDWHHGYVVEIPYSLGFYKEMVPSHLAFCAVATGKQPGNILRPKRILELGFGMGLGFVIGAAANPDTHFEGCDFNPEHSAHARDLAAAGGVDNVTISDASFQELAAAAREGQADLDAIVLHGTLSWVSQEARLAIVEIARKRLAPGGVLYVSYNCQPGWAPLMPLQRLMREVGKRTPGSVTEQMNAAIELFKAMSAENAAYFTANPMLAARIERMEKMSRNYLAHEYLNADWNIFHFADVAQLFGGAKLSFMASASIAENMDQISVPEAMRPRVVTTTDPIWKETLRDHASNKQFRRDIFARGVSVAAPFESGALLDGFRFVSLEPSDKMSFTIQTLIGEMNGNEELYGAFRDLLADGMPTVADLAAHPAFEKFGKAGALQVVALMVHTGQVLPVAPGQSTNFEPAHRLNRTLANLVSEGRSYNFLAAPAAGSGVAANVVEMLIAKALLNGIADDTISLTAAVLASMTRLGLNPVKDGAGVTEEPERTSLVRIEIEAFVKNKLPIWRRLGVL